MALYEILQTKGIFSTKLAKLTGFRRTTIHDWLTNPERVPNGKKMLKLCQVLNVTANDILGFSESAKTNKDKVTVLANVVERKRQSVVLISSNVI